MECCALGLDGPGPAMAPRAYIVAAARSDGRDAPAIVELRSAARRQARDAPPTMSRRANVASDVYHYFPTRPILGPHHDTTSRARRWVPRRLRGARQCAGSPRGPACSRLPVSAPLRWSQHEAHLIPELGAFHARFREQHLQLIRDAIAPRGGRAAAAAVGLVEVLTRYSSWETLTQDHGLSDDEAAATVLGALRPIITARREAPKGARKIEQPKATRTCI